MSEKTLDDLSPEEFRQWLADLSPEEREKYRQMQERVGGGDIGENTVVMDTQEYLDLHPDKLKFMSKDVQEEYIKRHPNAAHDLDE